MKFYNNIAKQEGATFIYLESLSGQFLESYKQYLNLLVVK